MNICRQRISGTYSLQGFPRAYSVDYLDTPFTAINLSLYVETTSQWFEESLIGYSRHAFWSRHRKLISGDKSVLVNPPLTYVRIYSHRILSKD